MKLTPEQALQKAIEAHKAGKAKEADQYYTAILKANPKHPDANHNIGVLAVGVGKVLQALPFFKTALEVNPNITQYWLSFIDALIKLDRIDEAKTALAQAKHHGANGDKLQKLDEKLKTTQTSENQVAKAQDLYQIEELIALYQKGHLNQVLTEAEKLLRKFPDSSTIYNILGATHQGLGKLDKAIEAYEKAISIKPDYAEALSNFGNALKDQGKLDKAIEAYEKAISIKPDFDTAYYNMGNALKDQGKLDKAIEAYKNAVSIKPSYAQAHYNLGNACKERGKLNKAIKAYDKALVLKPDYPQAHNNLGLVFHEQSELDKAIESFNKALALKPDYAEAYNNLGISLHEQGKLTNAIESFNKALALKPDNTETYNNLGIALHERGELDKAIESFNKALALKPDNTETYNNLGIALHERGELDKAIESFNKALAFKPDNAKAFNNKGIVLQDQNMIEKAIDAYSKAVALKPDFSEAYRNLSAVKQYTASDPQFTQLQVIMNDESTSLSSRCNLSFALAKMYEDIGNFDQAFKYLSEGNALRKGLLNYSIQQDENLFKQLQETQLNLNRKPKSYDKIKGPIPIFIVGMPRSGTTLVEQIISSHSKVTGAGELQYVSLYGGAYCTGLKEITDAAIFEFREKYLYKLQISAKGKQFITDKMPQNFRFIPLICSAFPEAKIVHVRRNAAATCWSNYKQYFTTRNLGYSYDLKDVAAYYKLYNGLMRLWQSEYDKRIYNLNYEELTSNQTIEIKRLIDYLDLKWEPVCLSPHENKRSVMTASQQQVRKNIYKGSSKAWQKYKPFLNGEFDSL